MTFLTPPLNHKLSLFFLHLSFPWSVTYLMDDLESLPESAVTHLLRHLL